MTAYTIIKIIVGIGLEIIDIYNERR